jgi:hypothetical protein
VGHLGTTQDVGNLVSFLVTPEARFITGILHVFHKLSWCLMGSPHCFVGQSVSISLETSWNKLMLHGQISIDGGIFFD